MKRYYVLFKGRVQGVGFRWQLSNLALQNAISGSVKNLDNGDVECYMQGEKEKILAVIAKIQNISPYIRIDDYFIKELELKDEKGFRVLY